MSAGSKRKLYPSTTNSHCHSTQSLSSDEPPLADYVEPDSTSFDSDSVYDLNSDSEYSVQVKKRIASDDNRKRTRATTSATNLTMPTAHQKIHVPSNKRTNLKIVIPAQKSPRPPQIRSKRFTSSEDERIIQYVTECGGDCTNVQWLALEEELGRQNLSSQLRWKNVLKPRLRNALAEQSGAILMGLSTGQTSPVAMDLPPKALINTLQYKRHTFSAQDNERILQFALERTGRNIPWTHLDRELGRNGGSCKHRYDSLSMRCVKDTMKDMLDFLEKKESTPVCKTSAPRRSRHQVSLELRPQLARVTGYTPEEDEIITSTVRGSPEGHLTVAGWRALAARLGRPESWLRYRWAILSKQEEETQAAQAKYQELLRLPAVDEINKQVFAVMESMVKTVSERAQRRIVEAAIPHKASTSSASSRAIVPPPTVSSAVVTNTRHPPPPNPCPRRCTASELTHIAVQMAKCQEIGDDVWLYLSLQIPYLPDTIKRFWLEYQQQQESSIFTSSSVLFSHLQQTHIISAVEERLMAQKQQAWEYLAQSLRMTLEQVQSVWSQLWFLVFFPQQYPAGFVLRGVSSPFFSDLDNVVIVHRMRASSQDRALPMWLPDLARFLCKPEAWVAVQWEHLRLHQQQSTG